MATGPGEMAAGSAPVQTVRLLLIDDEADTLSPVLAQGLEPLGFSMAKASEPAEAMLRIEDEAPDAILLDLHFPGDGEAGDEGTTGGRLLTRIRRESPTIPVLVFTTRLDDVDIPLESFEERPHGYFAKPEFDPAGQWAIRLDQAIRDAIAAARHAEAPDVGDPDFVVGKTPEMREAAAAIRTAAGNRLMVVVYGESGTGRRRAAEAIHTLGGLAGPFEHFHCSGVGSEAAEAALFGGGSGPGQLERTDGGTLFLDEVQDLPAHLQYRVTTAVESGGAARTASGREAGARLIVSTNHSLSDLVADGALREDLAHRLAGGLPVSLPPLRRRLVDLPEFFVRFVGEANEEANRHVSTVLRPETRERLAAHDWPGNLREFKSTIVRAVATADSNILLPENIEIPRIVSAAAAGAAALDEPGTADTTVADSPTFLLLTDEMEGLPVAERYDFLRNLGNDLRRGVLIEFIRRLRETEGNRIQHKVLGAALDPLTDPIRDLNRIRQFLHGCGIRLTKLEFNR